MESSNPKEESIVRTIMKNDFVLLGGIIAAVMGFVVQVVLPLQRISIQLAQIQVDIVQTKIDYQAAMTEHISLGNRITVIETEIRPFVR